jgi:hypothetical protein
MTDGRHARISITLPAETLAAADAFAQRESRSRSWALAEAMRRLAETGSRSHERRTADVGPVRASARASDTAPAPLDLDPSRLAQLERDLALTPEERVREAEETLRLSELLQKDETPPGPRVFERYDEFLDWQQFGRLVEP